MATLELQGLTKRFGEFTAVDSMNLKAAEGERIALLGGSAAIAGGIRYLLVVLVAGGVWPLTFWWCSRLGKR